MSGKTLYHFGIVNSCAVERIYVGGLCFVKHTEKLHKENRSTSRSRVIGDYAELTQEQVDNVIKGSEKLVVRQFGKSRFDVIAKAHPGFENTVNAANDVPVSDLIYMTKAERNAHKEVATPEPISAKRKLAKSA